MATIREQQLTLLQNNSTELLEFKVYSSDGTYTSTLSEDVLLVTPTTLRPLKEDLVTEYIRPLKFLNREIKVGNKEIVNKNPTFRYSTYDWTMGGGALVNVVKDLYDALKDSVYRFTPLPVSDNWMVKSNTSQMPASGTIGGAILTTSARTFINPTTSYEVGFYYYFFKQCDNINYSCAENYTFHITCGLDNNGDGSPNYVYDFQENKFESGTSYSTQHYKVINTSTNNQWVSYKTSVNPPPSAAGSSIRLLLTIYAPSRDAVDVYLGANWFDNVYVANKSSSGEILEEKNEIYQQTGAYKTSGVYTKKNVSFTNTLQSNTVNGKFGGVFKRRNSNRTGSLDYFINQEMSNDYRTFVKRYEGTFYNDSNGSTPIQMYNRIWFNFGSTLLQDSASSVIDQMQYNIKKNEYKIVTHIPNQDDDVSILENYSYKK